MQDESRQSARATRLIDSLSAEAPGFVPLLALVELVWVLAGSYGLTRAQVATVLATLLRSREPVLDRAEVVPQAQKRNATDGADFADALIEPIAVAAGCTATMTFDAGAAKSAATTQLP